MYLFFDTETTGLPRIWDAPVNDLNNWPRLVQMAYLLYDRDGHLIDQGDYIIRPDGFTIPLESSRVHRITTELALEEGCELQKVMDQFNALLNEADCLVAHNIAFDEKIMGAEFLRCGMPNPIPSKNKICTMLSSIELCALKGRFGYKWPKLSELHQRLFGCNFDEAHNAAADITATAKCFWELKRIGVV